VTRLANYRRIALEEFVQANDASINSFLSLVRGDSLHALVNVFVNQNVLSLFACGCLGVADSTKARPSVFADEEDGSGGRSAGGGDGGRRRQRQRRGGVALTRVQGDPARSGDHQVRRRLVLIVVMITCCVVCAMPRFCYSGALFCRPVFGSLFCSFVIYIYIYIYIYVLTVLCACVISRWFVSQKRLLG
jgi:hypothetical protein